jgi:hypothetical protein
MYMSITASTSMGATSRSTFPATLYSCSMSCRTGPMHTSSGLPSQCCCWCWRRCCWSRCCCSLSQQHMYGLKCVLCWCKALVTGGCVGLVRGSPAGGEQCAALPTLLGLLCSAYCCELMILCSSIRISCIRPSVLRLWCQSCRLPRSAVLTFGPAAGNQS